MKHITILLLWAFGSVAHADDWIPIASNNETAWDIMARSLEETQTKAGIKIVVVIGRVTTAKSNRIELYKWYVSMQDCERKMGSFVTLGIDGSYKWENDFVFGGGNIGSRVAESICSAYQYNVQKVEEEKGI